MRLPDLFERVDFDLTYGNPAELIRVEGQVVRRFANAFVVKQLNGRTLYVTGSQYREAIEADRVRDPRPILNVVPSGEFL